MADVFYNIDNSNVTVIENRDLDRIAKLLQDYTKEAEVAYLKTPTKILSSNIFNIIYISSLILFIGSIIFNVCLLTEFNKHYSQNNLLFFFTTTVINLSLPIVVYAKKQIEKNKDKLLLSQKRLGEVIIFASQTLEHQPLTDIRKFEFKLLLKDAEEVLIKCKEVTKE